MKPNLMFSPLAGTFSSIHRTVRDSLNDSLLKLLTPKRRIDIIRDVLEAKQAKRYRMIFYGNLKFEFKFRI